MSEGFKLIKRDKCPMCDVSKSQLTEALERVKVLEDALSFYADVEKMYDTAYDARGETFGYVRGLDDDNDMEKIKGMRIAHHGKRARAALAKIETEK